MKALLVVEHENGSNKNINNEIATAFSGLGVEIDALGFRC